MMLHLHLALLADAHHRAGSLEAALTAVEHAIAEVGPTGHFYEAEAHRLRGNILLAGGPDCASEAEKSLRRAVAVARAQRASGFLLRAETDLARAVST